MWTDLDIAVFCRLAEKLGITRRFVGSEPFCPVTSAYNRAMARKLPEKGIELVELPRLEQGGTAPAPPRRGPRLPPDRTPPAHSSGTGDYTGR